MHNTTRSLQKIVWLTCFFMYTQAIAQDKKQIISGNDDIATGIPDSIKYLYPGFTYGKVYYKDGTVGGAMLNYNVLVGAIQFVNGGKDTLSLANEATIRYVVVNKDTFCYDKVYVRLIAGNEIAKLARGEKISLSNIKKGAAFDSYTSLGGVDNIGSLNVGSRTIHLADNKQMVFVKHSVLYIGDSYNHFLPATKKNVLKMFGKNKNLVNYLDNHNVDFTKEEDLKTLIDFIGS